MKKRVLSLLLTALLILSVFPLNIAFAAAIGDVDGNGKITAADARIALRASVGLENLTADQIKVADVDGKPGIAASDARLILRASVGLETLHTHEYKDAITKAPTCTEKGVKTFTCECGDSYTEEIAAKGHTEVTDKEVAPTCTKTGLKGGSHCSVCNIVIKKADVVAAKGHTPVTDKAVAPTCTATGKTEGQHCSVCNAVIKAQTTVPAKGHTVVTDKAVAATCTATGKTEGQHCSVCNAVIKAQTTVPAKGHTVVTDKAVAATCTATGKTEGQHCSVCNTVIKAQTTVPAKGHTVVTDKAVAATCTATGKTEGQHCSVCNTVIKAQETVPAKGHTVVNDAAVAPTCTETGKTDGQHCSVCNTVIKAQDTVNALGHTSVTDRAVEPTCTETGKTEGQHCSVCNAVIKAQETLPAKGHTEVIDAALAPTCTATGLSEGKHCSVCHTVIKAQVTVPANGHTEVVLEAKEATCKETGLTAGKSCSVCNEVLVQQEEIPVLTEHVMIIVEVPASCSSDGYTIERCKYCEDYYNQETLTFTQEATGHKWGEPTIVAPTCTEQGYTVTVCTECESDEKTDFTDATGHSYSWNTTKEASCTETGSRTGTCSVCGDVVTETIGIQPCIPSETAIKVTGSKTENISCKEVIKCTICDKIIAEAETDNAHRTTQSGYEKATCTADGERTMACRYCNYTKTIATPATGHYNSNADIKKATCTEDGHVDLSGICDYCGETFEGVRSVLKATGHTPEGIQSCTTSVTCSTCSEVLEPALGHDNTITAAAYNAEINTFFCSRCNATADTKADKLDTFNNVVNKIPTNAFFYYYFLDSGKTNRLVYMNKSSVSTTYSRFDFGIYTSAVKSLYEEEMGNTPDSYSRVTDTYISTKMYLFETKKGTHAVSLLKENDIDSITVEKLPSLKISDVLSDFATTYTATNSKEYDISKYKNVNVNESVIKVTIDVKNEKLSTVKNLPANELTAFQKSILGEGVNIRTFTDGFEENSSGEFVKSEVDKGDGYEISMTMKLREISSDGKIVYYFRESTYEPIIALYYTDITMDQAINMKFKIGISINGAIDPIIRTQTVEAYLFPTYFDKYEQ